MSFQHQAYNLASHQPRKSVFMTGRNQSKVNCSFLELFQHKGILTCEQGQKSEQITPRESRKLQDMTATKLSKKSLKLHPRYNELFQNTVRKEQLNLNVFHTNTEKNISNSIQGLSRQASKVFSKTTSSEICSNIIKKPAAGNSQLSKLGQHSYKCSSENIINSSFHKGQLSESCKLERQRLSHIPMVQSISKNSVEGMVGVRQSREVRPFVNPEVFNFQRVKIVDSISQSFDMLGISPVKQIVIPEVSERSGINSRNPTQRKTQKENLTISQKMEFRAPPQIRKVISEEYSQFLRSTPNKKIEDSIKQSIPLQAVPEQKRSKIMVYDQSKVEFEGEKRDYLEISFDKQEQQIEKKQDGNSLVLNGRIYQEFNQGEMEKSVCSLKSSQIYDEQVRKSQVDKSKIHSTSSKVFSANGKQIQDEKQKEVQQQAEYAEGSRQILNQVLQSSIQSNKQKSDSSQQQPVEQQKMLPKFKAPKLQHITFGRHSVQIPRSKKFSGMQVRRTISMRDHQQSEQQQTSQVIYGFRKTHKEAIIQDINEDMQESCVTRTEHNFSNGINLGDFRQLLM